MQIFIFGSAVNIEPTICYGQQPYPLGIEHDGELDAGGGGGGGQWSKVPEGGEGSKVVLYAQVGLQEPLMFLSLLVSVPFRVPVLLLMHICSAPVYQQSFVLNQLKIHV